MYGEDGIWSWRFSWYGKIQTLMKRSMSVLLFLKHFSKEGSRVRKPHNVPTVSNPQPPPAHTGYSSTYISQTNQTSCRPSPPVKSRADAPRSLSLPALLDIPPRRLHLCRGCGGSSGLEKRDRSRGLRVEWRGDHSQWLGQRGRLWHSRC